MSKECMLSILLKRLSEAIPSFVNRHSSFVIHCGFTRAAASGPKTASLIGKETAPNLRSFR